MPSPSSSSSALVVPLPLTSPSTQSLIQTHPALKFYSIYGQKFPNSPQTWSTTSYEYFYSADCLTILPNSSKISSGEKSWELFRRLYSKYPKGVEREILSLIIVDLGEEEGVYEIYMQCITKMMTSTGEGERRTVVEVPQSFVYTLGKADEGKGTMGMQFRKLRNFYDMRTLEEALGGPLELDDLVDSR